MNLKQESIQLITVNERNQFYLTDEARRLLCTISKPIAVVTIAGVYRSGKSYLVNRLLRNNRGNGFATGCSVEPVTKGLSMWSRPIPAEDEEGEEFVYLAVDSEGVGSCEQEARYDLKILMLVFLMSSTVIYNSLGAIDELTLDQLRTVLNLRQALPQASHKAKLVWVLRDFALQLVGKNGREMSANDYLEQCLEEVPSHSLEVRKKNEIRRAIKDTFGKRCCFPLVRPTIKEDDLRNLEQCCLRDEFLEGIEAIREQVFTGSKEDIKRIRGTALTGKLLAALLEECCLALNDNRLPEVKSMWESIRQCAGEEAFERLCSDVRGEVGRIALPLGKEQLRGKLNEIENRMYLRLQREYSDLEQFKKYHREFLHVLQKINRDTKRANAQIAKEKSLRELRQFVRANISMQDVEPTSLSLVKVLIDRMELRAKGEPEGYEYVLSVLFDLIHISEQKAVQMQRDNMERQQMLEAGCLERRNADISLASIRHDYHQALKTINNLKLGQEAAQKEGALCKQQLEMLQLNAKTLQQDADIKVQSLLRQLEEANFRARQRAEEHSTLVKRLREEKCELEREVETLKEQRLREGLNQRKEIIFEEKMKETWDRFEQERTFFRKELEKLRKQSQTHLQKYQEERRYREREAQQFGKQREAFIAKERESVQQLQELKNLHMETKKTYSATFDALKDNDRIFKSIENVSHSRLTTGKKNQNAEAIRRYYEAELEKTRSEHEEEIRALNTELAKANHLNHQQKLKYSEQQSRYRSCMTERERLQRQLQAANVRFSQTVGEVELAKQRQRSLYEQSIVRLLNNLQRREYSTQQYRR